MALTKLTDFSVADLEAVRILLRGDSVIDWHRLNFRDDGEIRDFLTSHEFHPNDPRDRARMDRIKDEAISYLRRHFEYPIPKPVERCSVEELFSLAASRGHRQTCACTIAKCMHIIHHLDGRELLFMLPLSDQEIFHLVEEKVYRVIGSMLAEGSPITEFVGGRKHKDSLYTKLLSKQETIASQVYDKLRFRIVTRSADDIFPVLQYLTKRLFPFNYVLPGQSINSMFHFKRYCEEHPHLGPMLGEMQAGADIDLTPSDNIFSADEYRVIHFVVDMPIRLPERILQMAPAAARELGPIVFVICEFQVIDRATEAANELGEASHAKYKDRQKRAVMRRLQLGMRQIPAPKPRSSGVASASDAARAPTHAPPAATPHAPPAATPHATVIAFGASSNAENAARAPTASGAGTTTRAKPTAKKRKKRRRKR